MLGTRRLLVIGAVIVGVLFLAFLATAITRKVNDPYKNTCDKFLKYLVDQNANASYNMMTQTAKKGDTAQSWKEKVISLRYIYASGKLHLDKKVSAQPAGITAREGQKTIGTRMQLNYTMEHPAGNSAIECTVIGNGDSYQVDGFVSSFKEKAPAR